MRQLLDNALKPKVAELQHTTKIWRLLFADLHGVSIANGCARHFIIREFRRSMFGFKSGEKAYALRKRSNTDKSAFGEQGKDLLLADTP